MRSNFSQIDLSKLSPPKVMEEKEPLSIKEEMIKAVESSMADGFKVLESDPIARLIEVFAYREAMLIKRMNYAASQCMLAFARGEALDSLALLLGATRTDETDEEFRKKALAGFDRLSTAGSFAGYKFHALDLGGHFLDDANPFSLAPGEVKIALLFGAEYYADKKLIEKRPELLRNLRHELERFRPITDKLELIEARFLDFELSASLSLGHGADSAKILESATERAKRYLESVFRIGRTVPLSALHAALHVDSNLVLDSKIISPKAEVVPENLDDLPYCVPRCTKIKIELEKE